MKMFETPTQITLRTGLDGPVCAFTVRLPFLMLPSPGHKLILESADQVGITVQDVFHFIPAKDKNPALLIIAHPLVIDNYDAMLRLLDWFKAMYEVVDLRSNTSSPATYYSFYRSLVNLMGLTEHVNPKVTYDMMNIKVFAESCRAIILAELGISDDELIAGISSYNDIIQLLHTMVLERKRDEKDGADMFLLIKRWERSINANETVKWEASHESCVNAARLVFGRLPSIPYECLPKPLRV